MGPGPTCQQVKPLFTGVHPAFFRNLIASSPSCGDNIVCAYLFLGVPIIGTPTRLFLTKGLNINPEVFLRSGYHFIFAVTLGISRMRFI